MKFYILFLRTGPIILCFQVIQIGQGRNINESIVAKVTTEKSKLEAFDLQLMGGGKRLNQLLKLVRGHFLGELDSSLF